MWCRRAVPGRGLLGHVGYTSPVLPAFLNPETQPFQGFQGKKTVLSEMGKVQAMCTQTRGGNSVGEHPTQQFAQAWAHCPPQGNTQARRFQWRRVGVRAGGQGQVTPGGPVCPLPPKLRAQQPSTPAGVRPFSLCPVLLPEATRQALGTEGKRPAQSAGAASAHPDGPCCLAVCPRSGRGEVGGCGGSLQPQSASLSLPPTPGEGGSGCRAYRAFGSGKGWQPSELRRRADAFPK